MEKTTSIFDQIWKLIWPQVFIKLGQVRVFTLIFHAVIYLYLSVSVDNILKLSWRIFSIGVKSIMKEPYLICLDIEVSESLLKLFFQIWNYTIRTQRNKFNLTFSIEFTTARRMGEFLNFN